MLVQNNGKKCKIIQEATKEQIWRRNLKKFKNTTKIRMPEMLRNSEAKRKNTYTKAGIHKQTNRPTKKTKKEHNSIS